MFIGGLSFIDLHCFTNPRLPPLVQTNDFTFSQPIVFPPQLNIPIWKTCPDWTNTSTTFGLILPPQSFEIT